MSSPGRTIDDSPVTPANAAELLNLVADGTISGGMLPKIGSALDAVKQWRYKPYFLNGEPVEVETVVTVNFTLAG